MPDVLVKGGDYTVEQIAGAKEVIANGGKVVLADMVEGVSTTGIIERMRG
jgi:D-beta-D-heptose 7-phosphate kinase/D-beta-D-heptose 1-phosphate adenosyltransferase